MKALNILPFRASYRKYIAGENIPIIDSAIEIEQASRIRGKKNFSFFSLVHLGITLLKVR